MKKISYLDTDKHKVFINPLDIDNPTTKTIVYDVDKSSKRHNKHLPYFYMAAREQGRPLLYSIKGLNISDDEDWINYFEDIANPVVTEESLITIDGFDPKFTPKYTTELYDACIDYYQKNDDRVIFIYGSIDFWTGCGINDVWKDVRSDRNKYPTFGFDTKKQMSYHIAKDKGHTAIITNLEPAEAQKVWNKIERWMK